MSQAKSNSLAYSLFFLTLLFSIIELNAPLFIYGGQLVWLFLCVVLAYFFRLFISSRIVLLSFLSSLIVICLSFLQFSYLEYRGIFWLNTIRTLFWINCAIFLYGYFSRVLTSNDFLSVIKVLIIISSLTVIAQFISFYIFRVELDFSILFGGDGVRSVYSGMEGINYRPTGLTSEPAIHSGIMMGLLTLLYIIDNKCKLVPFLGLSSVLLTFSTLGAILVLLYLVVVYTKNIQTVIAGLFLLVIFSLFVGDSLIARYEFFMSGEDGSNNVKLEVIEYLFSKSNYILFGLGFVGKDSHAPDFFEALYDLTYFLNLYVYFGVILGAIILIITLTLLCKSSFRFREKLLICLVLLKLSGPTFMFFNFFIMGLFILHKFKVSSK